MEGKNKEEERNDVICFKFEDGIPFEPFIPLTIYLF